MKANRAMAFVTVSAMLAATPMIMYADPELVNPFEDTAPEPDIASLVGQLSHDDFMTREEAMKKLWELGPIAMPALRAVVEKKDPELTERTRELMLYIGAGVLPDSPADIKAMVLEYSNSPVDTKLVILKKLTGRGHWRQVLHLANMEKNDSVRNEMFGIVQKYAGEAARKALAEGNLDLVGEIVELMGDSDPALIVRAWYYKQRGQLPAQLEKAADMPGKKGNRWRLALYRVDGNLPKAMEEAKALENGKLIAALQLLQGDPLPWLLTDIPGKAGLDPILELARRIQIAQLKGDKKKALSMARELPGMARSSTTNQRVVGALAGTGFRDLALDLLVQREPTEAFAYFDNMEAPLRALQVLGISPDASAPYPEWVKKATAQALEEEEYRAYVRPIMLGSFLVRHGQGQHAMAVVRPMMDALKEDGSDVWFDLIYSMVIYDLGQEVLTLVEERGNDDAEADRAVRKIFRNLSEKSVNHIWEAIKKRHDNDLGKSLHEIAILSGLITDSNDEVPALQKALLAGAKEDKDVDEKERITAVFSFAMTRGDMDSCLEICKRMANGDEAWMNARQYYEKELFRWEDMAAHYAGVVKKNPGDYRSAVYYYIALRKLGKDEETKGMMERIMLLSMGDASVLSSIGTELYKVGYYKEATDLWLQTMVMAEPGGSVFDATLGLLVDSPQHLYDSSQWKVSAALVEANIQLLMRGSGEARASDMLRARFKADFARGMNLLQSGERKEALVILDAARKLVPGDGTLADHFFPSLLKAGIGETYEKWLDESYNHVAKAASLYPGSHNTHNTAAWLCSRAVRKLDVAHKHSAAALELRPEQGAYLDTMAEVWFARGDRGKAIEWSQKAVNVSSRYPQSVFRMRKYVFQNYQQLQLQFDRFKEAPLHK